MDFWFGEKRVHNHTLFFLRAVVICIVGIACSKIFVLARRPGSLYALRVIALFEIRRLTAQHTEGEFHPWSKMILRRRDTISIFESSIQRSEFHSSSCRLFVNEFGRLPCRFPGKLKGYQSRKALSVTEKRFSLSR